jgi:hypothetical protein
MKMASKIAPLTGFYCIDISFDFGRAIHTYGEEIRYTIVDNVLVRCQKVMTDSSTKWLSTSSVIVKDYTNKLSAEIAELAFNLRVKRAILIDCDRIKIATITTTGENGHHILDLFVSTKGWLLMEGDQEYLSGIAASDYLAEA